MAGYTVKMLDGLKPRANGPYRLSDEILMGLNIQVSSNGNKAWVVKYRDERKRRKYVKIGTWPALGIAAARARARTKLAEIESGVDPKARPKADAATVEELLTHYMAAKVEAKSYKQMCTYQRKIPKWALDKLACDFSVDDCHDLLRPIAKATPTLANRVLTWLRTAYNHAIDIEYDLTRDRDVSFGVKNNPFKDIKMIQSAENASTIRLTMENLAAAWVEIDRYQSITAQLAIKLGISLYGQRIKNYLWADWDMVQEVDGITCLSLPEGHTKSGKPFIYPLTPLALEIIEETRLYTGHRKCIFPQRDSNGDTPMSLVGLSAASRKVRDIVGCGAMGQFSPRYCRATAVTELGNIGVDRHLIDLAQQRRIRTVSGIGSKHYDRSHRAREIYEGVALPWDNLVREAIKDYKHSGAY